MTGKQPERLGRYEIREEIGRGGQGVVYRAYHPQLGRDVAIKLLHESASDDADVLKRFQREAHILAELDIPGICKVLDVDKSSGRPFIVMEFVEGTSLGVLVDQPSTAWDKPAEFAQSKQRSAERSATARTTPVVLSTLAMRAAVSTVESIARSLADAHNRGIWHRDIKPGNIMLKRDGTPVILDFGLAFDARDEGVQLTRTGDRMGTPAYMSPEQVARRRAQVDERTDIWSLGVVLYEMLAMQRPFKGDSVAETEDAILSTHPPDLRRLATNISQDLVAVVEKALEKNLAQRYGKMSDFADELRRVLDRQPVRARRVGPFGRVLRWAQREPAVAGSLGAVVLALGIGLTSSMHSLRVAEEAQAETQVQLGVAQRRLDEWQLLADGRELEGLFRLAKDEHWPARAEKVAALEEWLVRARRLVARLPTYRETRVELRKRMPPRDASADAAERAEFDRKLRIRLAECDAIDARLNMQEDEAKAELELTGRLLEELNTPQVVREFGVWLPQRRRQIEARTASLEARLLRFTDDHAKIAQKRAEWKEALAWLPDPWRADEPRLDELARSLGIQRKFACGSDWGLGVQHEAVQKLVNDVSFLAEPIDPEAALEQYNIAWMEKRLALAKALAARSVEEAKDALRACAERVGRHPAYGGLSLVPQLGLVPLGPDPVSGLEEFADLQTGIAPHRGADGRLSTEDDMAIVFVLIPGGEFHMGAQATDPAAPNHDPGALPVAGPMHPVRISAFFMGKYEVTQSQWMCVNSANPSLIKVHHVGGGRVITPRNPVDNPSWLESNEFLRRLGFELPTEAQWEYACRAGTSSQWPGAKVPEDLKFLANLAERCMQARSGAPDMPVEPWSDDEYGHCPVGTFGPNAFGLHDMMGNQSEWCRDSYNETTYADRIEAETKKPEAERSSVSVDPFVRAGVGRYVMRGGSWQDMAVFATAALRSADGQNSKQYLYGLRAARALSPR